MPYAIVGRLLSGRYLIRWDGGEVRLGDRGVLLFPPHGYTHLHDCGDTDCVTISLAALLRVAEETTGLDATARWHTPGSDPSACAGAACAGISEMVPLRTHVGVR